MTQVSRFVFSCLLLWAAATAPSVAWPASDAGRISEPEVTPITVSDAVYLALRNNYGVRSAYLQRVAQKFDLRVSEDAFTPKLKLSSRYLSARNQTERYRTQEFGPSSTLLTEWGTRFSLSWFGIRNDAARSGKNTYGNTEFSFSQPLLKGWGRNVNRAPLLQARLQEQAYRLTLQTTLMNTVTQVVMAYHEVVRAEAQLGIAQQSLNRSRELLGINRALVDAGRMAAFEVVQTEADLATQELAEEDSHNRLAASRMELLRLLALDLFTVFSTLMPQEAGPTQIGEAEALRVAEENEPGYLQQFIANERVQLDLLVARNQQLWDVSLVGGSTQLDSRYQGGGTNTRQRNWDHYVGLQLEIPLGDLSIKQGLVHAETATKNQALRFKEARQALEQQVRNSVRDVHTRWRQLQIAKRAAELSTRKLEIEKEKLRVGRSSNFQVLSYEADLRTAESARLNALIGYLNAQTILDQHLGMTLKNWEIELDD